MSADRGVSRFDERSGDWSVGLPFDNTTVLATKLTLTLNFSGCWNVTSILLRLFVFCVFRKKRASVSRAGSQFRQLIPVASVHVPDNPCIFFAVYIFFAI